MIVVKEKNNKKYAAFGVPSRLASFWNPTQEQIGHDQLSWSLFFLSHYLHFTSFSREALSSMSALNFSTTLTWSSTRLKTGPRHSTRRSWHLKFVKFLALTELLQICGDSLGIIWAPFTALASKHLTVPVVREAIRRDVKEGQLFRIV